MNCKNKKTINEKIVATLPRRKVKLKKIGARKKVKLKPFC